MNLKNLTENRYTLNDIFTKNYQAWLMIPLLIYFLTPIIHLITYVFTSKEDVEADTFVRILTAGEVAGDYYIPIIHFAFLIGGVFAVIALFSYFANARQNKLKPNADSIPTIFFMLFFALIVVSTIVNKTDTILLLGYTSRAEGVTSVICYLLVYYLCGSLITKPKIKYFVSYLFLVTGFIIAILTLVDKYVVDIELVNVIDLSGIFYHFNFYGYYLAMSVSLAAGLFVFEKKKLIKILLLFLFLLNSFLLSINNSLGSFLATCVALAFLFVFTSIKERKFKINSFVLIVLFLSTIFVVGLFTDSYFSELIKLGNDVERIVTDPQNAGDAGTSRWTLWTHTAEYIKEKPWIGWGFEGTAERLATETHTEKAHNEYLENMAYYGIPAGILYVIGIASLYIKSLIKIKKLDSITIVMLTVSCAYIVSALFGNSFIFIAPFYFAFIGMANRSQSEILDNHSID